MQIQGLEHFTIRTPDLDATADFYTRALGLIPGHRPAFRFPGVWLYATGRPILHLVAATGRDDAMEAYLGRRNDQKGSGRLDHISLRGTDLSALQAHLLHNHFEWRERIVPEALEHQIFLDDPNGITIEVIFPYSPHNRIVGTAMAALEMAP